jgi:hypothetical protein
MTIADAFNDITVANGGTPDTSGTIAGAIDKLADTLAGEDLPERATIEESVAVLGQYIAGGGEPRTYTLYTSGTGVGINGGEVQSYSQENPGTVSTGDVLTINNPTGFVWYCNSYEDAQVGNFVRQDSSTSSYTVKSVNASVVYIFGQVS